MAKKKEFKHKIESLDIYLFADDIDAVIQKLDQIKNDAKAQGFTRVAIEEESDLYGEVSNWKVVGWRPETDKEQEKRLAREKKARERKKQKDAEKKQKELEQLKKLANKLGVKISGQKEEKW